GAARSLREAVLINPYATDSFADAIHSALAMEEPERRERMRRLRWRVAHYDIGVWAREILRAIRQREFDAQNPSGGTGERAGIADSEGRSPSVARREPMPMESATAGQFARAHRRSLRRHAGADCARRRRSASAAARGRCAKRAGGAPRRAGGSGKRPRAERSAGANSDPGLLVCWRARQRDQPRAGARARAWAPWAHARGAGASGRASSRADAGMAWGQTGGQALFAGGAFPQGPGICGTDTAGFLWAGGGRRFSRLAGAQGGRAAARVRADERARGAAAALAAGVRLGVLFRRRHHG